MWEWKAGEHPATAAHALWYAQHSQLPSWPPIPIAPSLASVVFLAGPLSRIQDVAHLHFWLLA